MVGKQLLEKLPADLQAHFNELNFNIAQEKPIAAMLLLRIPLSIVRFFQTSGSENKILNVIGEYIEPAELLKKLEGELRSKKPA